MTSDTWIPDSTIRSRFTKRRISMPLPNKACASPPDTPPARSARRRARRFSPASIQRAPAIPTTSALPTNSRYSRKNPSADHPRAPLFWHYPHWGNQGGIPCSAIRDGDWKLIKFYWKNGTELYNLSTDPGEQHNLAAGNPTKVAALTAELDAFLKDTDALMPIPNPKAAAKFKNW